MLGDCLSAPLSFSAVGKESWYMPIVSPTSSLVHERIPVGGKGLVPRNPQSHSEISPLRCAFAEIAEKQGCVYLQGKIFKGGCEKEGLMQYKCMEKEIRKLHGRILFPSVMYIANIPAGMQL